MAAGVKALRVGIAGTGSKTARTDLSWSTVTVQMVERPAQSPNQSTDTGLLPLGSRALRFTVTTPW